METFYEEHAGKFFFNRLTTYMSSGPVLVWILHQGETTIPNWRALLGPTKVALHLPIGSTCVVTLESWIREFQSHVWRIVFNRAAQKNPSGQTLYEHIVPNANKKEPYALKIE